jgi:outer membrane protein TolC
MATLPAPPRFEPQIEDPLLTPAEPAKQVVTKWDEAMDLLRKGSTDDRIAVAGVERAQGRWQQSLAALLPNARGTATLAIDVLHPSKPPLAAAGAGALGASSSEKVPTAPLGTTSLTVTQQLVDFGAWRGLRSAEAGQRGANASLQDVRRRLTQGLARSLVAVVAAERIAELNRLGLRQALERAALTTRTVELGAATQLDVVRVQQDVEVARGTLVAGDEQLRRTRDALGLALGLDHDAGVSPSFDLSGLVQEIQTQCTAIPSIQERSDLVAAREQVTSAELSREQASAGYLPTLGLSTGLTGVTTTPGPGRIPLWSLSAVLTVPIWEGGLRKGLIQERQGIETQAAETLERTRRDVSIEVARARRNVAVAEALLKTAKDARALAVRTDEMTRRAFEVGRSSSLELVQSAVALRQADTTLAAREFDWVQARLDALLTEAKCDW